MAKFGFNPREVEASAPINYDPIPKGEYKLKATEAETKQTKDKSGDYINATFEVASGEYTGRKIWHIFNVNNKSEKAQQIGRQDLVAWATACGKPDADDTDKLMEKPFLARVDIEHQEGYEPRNRIKGFLFSASDAPAKSSASPAKEKPAPAAKEKPAATSGGSKANPWD